MLAPLNNMIAVFLDEVQPNEDGIVRFFKWKSDGSSGGAPTSNGNVPAIGVVSFTNTTTTVMPAVLIPQKLTK
jgi:hypothetical protein